MPGDGEDRHVGPGVLDAEGGPTNYGDLAVDSLEVVAKAKTGDGPRAFRAFIQAVD